MSPRARRLVLVTVSVLFLGLSAVVLIMTGGWRIDHGQIIRGAGLFVDSRPETSVAVDGLTVGTTPYRATTFSAGHDILTLSRPGYHSWSTNIQLTLGSSLAVATIRLFPVVTPHLTTTLTTDQSFIVDASQRVAWNVHHVNDSNITIATVQGSAFTTPLTIPFVPTALLVNNDISRVYVQNDTQAGILTAKGGWWTTPRVSDPVWATDGSAVLFGLQDGHILRLDGLAKTTTILDTATSLTLVGGQLWGTTLSATGTSTVWRRDLAATATPTSVMTFPSATTLISTNWNELILKNGNGGLHVSGNRTTGYTSQPIGSFTSLLTGDPQPLSWTDGTLVAYRGSNGQSILVDRFPTGVIWAGWFHQPDVIAVFDGQTVTVYDHLDNNQSTIVARQVLPTGAQFLGSNANHDGFWYRLDQQVYFWTWRTASSASF